MQNWKIQLGYNQDKENRVGEVNNYWKVWDIWMYLIVIMLLQDSRGEGITHVLKGLQNGRYLYQHRSAYPW